MTRKQKKFLQVLRIVCERFRNFEDKTFCNLDKVFIYMHYINLTYYQQTRKKMINLRFFNQDNEPLFIFDEDCKNLIINADAECDDNHLSEDELEHIDFILERLVSSGLTS